MNYLEFVSTHHVGVSVEHSSKVFSLTKILYLKNLNSVRFCPEILYGGVRWENISVSDSGLFNLPMTGNDVATYFLQRKPFIETGVVVSNNLKILRIDLLMRFPYLNHPDVSSGATRRQFIWSYHAPPLHHLPKIPRGKTFY